LSSLSVHYYLVEMSAIEPGLHLYSLSQVIQQPLCRD
jgi:hypothetical protein